MSLKPPPITFTQTQTAAEKQIVGEDKELEANGWLIASAQDSSSGSEDWKKSSTYSTNNTERDRKYILSLQELAYYAPRIRKLKVRGFIAEGLDGNLVLLEKKDGNTNDPKEKEHIQQLLKIINNARNKVIQAKLENIYKKQTLNTEQKEKLKQKLQLSFYNQTLSGEYYEIKKGVFEKKK